MEMNNVTLDAIRFPVYRLGPYDPIIDGDVVYYIRGTNLGTSDEVLETLIIDDRSIPHDSLALRRLQVPARGGKLQRLGLGLFFIGDLVKSANPRTWFIDSNGKLFKYQKTTRVKLIYRPIEQVIPISTGGAIICVKGIPSRFKTLFRPPAEKTHAGLLVVKNSYILYGLYDQQYDTSIRMI